MDMQQMPMGKMSMGDMHNSFWRDDQVSIVFQSSTPLIVEDDIFNPEPLRELDLPVQLEKLNRFLQEKEVPVTLHFLNDGDHADLKPPVSPQISSTMERSESAGGLRLPPGIHPFGFPVPIESSFGPIRTSVISFFQIEKRSSHGGMGSASMKMHDSGDDDDNLIPLIVRTLNENLEELNGGEHIPITIAAPTWLSGGTPVGAGQGCPLTPPIPVKDSCSNWHIRLPDLPYDLKSKQGDGVTVFILDSFPERGEIARGARDAGDDNLLLRKVNESVEFDYGFMSGVKDVQEEIDTKGTFVGKDVYGRHYPIKLADHGLFIAGIVRDVAPHARMECIRILDDLCVGDLELITHALEHIYFRKALQSGDLYGKPVVINMSLVIPTDDEAHSRGIDTTIGGFNNVWASLKHAIKSLSDIGVIIAASAGNEGDLRETPGGNRPDALYPAKFANAPDSIDGVIPVGAVNSSGNPSSYSCYPGLRGVATYGGEVPIVTPPSPPNPTSNHPDVKITDAPRGIYSSVEYAPLSADPPEQYYAAPNDHAWAYWVGTSFATPIISALAARILELQAQGHVINNVHQAILNAATDTTPWDRLDPSKDGSSTATGNMLKAVQHCIAKDRDEEEEEEEEEEVEVVVVTIKEFNIS